MADAPASVDEYIAAFPDEVRDILLRVRDILHAAAPGAEEKIRYGMPAIMLGGRYAIHFAAWKKHLGLYPVPTADEPLESELAPYRSGEDSITFVYAKPIPYELIGRLAEFIVEKRR